MRLDIKMAILKAGRPQWEFAQKLGVPEYTLSRFIHGRGKLAPDKVQQLEGLFGLHQEAPDAAVH